MFYFLDYRPYLACIAQIEYAGFGYDAEDAGTAMLNGYVVNEV